MTVSTTTARHLVVRLGGAATLPGALLDALRQEVVTCGFLRGGGILHDVTLRTVDPETGSVGTERRLRGHVHVVSLEGSIGLATGDISCGLRAVLAREADGGLETIAGEITAARLGQLELLVTALDDVAATRHLDGSGFWFVDPSSATPRASAPAPAPIAAPPPPAPAPVAPPPVEPAPPPPVVAPQVVASTPAPVTTWAETARASEEASKPAAPPPPAPPPPPAQPRPSPTFITAQIPQRPQRRTAALEEDHVYPDAGDVVEHFAFGRCEVIKSDGDRLHLRLGKDGRVKEIALEMLRITPLPSEDGQTTRRFKLDRKL